jgi:hypothetical protein
MWDLWWTKRHWGMFSPSTSVSPANHSTKFSIIIITWGWHNRPNSGLSAKWTQLTPPHHYTNLKKLHTLIGVHYKCRICGKEFPSLRGIKYYLSKYRPRRPEPMNNAGGTSTTCEIFKKSFGNSTALSIHERLEIRNVKTTCACVRSTWILSDR